ncbi:MAG: hypothetical protein HUU38_26330 [Anaerolineales bacterium]|nr:hypothetical protein [Anaerolineales bacterium]
MTGQLLAFRCTVEKKIIICRNGHEIDAHKNIDSIMANYYLGTSIQADEESSQAYKVTIQLLDEETLYGPYRTEEVSGKYLITHDGKYQIFSNEAFNELVEFINNLSIEQSRELHQARKILTMNSLRISFHVELEYGKAGYIIDYKHFSPKDWGRSITSNHPGFYSINAFVELTRQLKMWKNHIDITVVISKDINDNNHYKIRIGEQKFTVEFNSHTDDFKTFVLNWPTLLAGPFNVDYETRFDLTGESIRINYLSSPPDFEEYVFSVFTNYSFLPVCCLTPIEFEILRTKMINDDIEYIIS